MSTNIGLQLEKEIAVITELARTAGAVLLRHYHSPFLVEQKVNALQEMEEVTAADRLIVESPSLTGLIVARAFAPEPSLLPAATAALRAAQCKPQ